jgi:hypothetical protein
VIADGFCLFDRMNRRSSRKLKKNWKQNSEKRKKKLVPPGLLVDLLLQRSLKGPGGRGQGLLKEVDG